ncbi:division/cell wall cluster transcriptional repressor MraZ [Pseudohongiella sp.]|nr:division/cell wall cluster transcriptional repressor MraZ [Pseudohongiella sp.]MBC54962.1 cell division/cell wall cluster transcriptional repressor MraZ [Gammaproteobacteria bacterium]HDZ10424.1 transcriptional regulator MraZ [Pseudohongiella sp.]HEA61953.1 transcriptional regulator MraZ [Pseudohongiella sp.]
MFRGVNTINLDAKGRMAMPARYRDLLTEKYGGRLVATVDFTGRCLLLYPIDEWEVIQQKVESLSSFDEASRRVQRMLIGHAHDLEMDGSGRLLLPQILRTRAQLDKHLALVGQGMKFEIWSEENWNEQADSWFAGTTGQADLPPELLSLSL